MYHLVVHLNNVYTSSANLTGWHHFTWRHKFFGVFMSPATLKHTYFSMQDVCYFCQTVTKFEFSPQMCIKVTNIKYHENPSSQSHTDTCRQTNGLTVWYYFTGTKHFYSNLCHPQQWNVFRFSCKVPKSNVNQDWNFSYQHNLGLSKPYICC